MCPFLKHVERRAIACGSAALVAREAPKGSTILCMLPDTGERYLSTPLFGDILPEMNDEERAIAQSTPTFADAAVTGASAPR